MTIFSPHGTLDIAIDNNLILIEAQGPWNIEYLDHLHAQLIVAVSKVDLANYAILITPKGNIHKRPLLTFRGIPVEDVEEFVYGLEDEIENVTRTFKLGSRKQEHNLIDALKIVCRKYSKEKTGKRPFTNINLARI
jgi:hypothetical protein